jgi:modulator of FtsH protease HflC
MRLPLPLLAGVAFAALTVASNAFFAVSQSQQAIVLQFGEVQRVVNGYGADDAGLKVKIPFVQQHIIYDKRILDLTPAGSREIIAADQERLEVDSFARWRIVDQLRFYQAVRTINNAEQRLESLLEASMRRVLATAPQNDIIAARRAALMAQIREQMNKETAALGIQVVDVKIRAADLPQANQDRVFQRMRTEREQVAARIRAEGDQKAREIRAGADRERAQILAQSYGTDPDFASFYRSMLAYEKAIGPGTTIVMSPQGDFFRYFDSRRGAGGGGGGQ